MRAGVFNRINGLVVAFVELAVWALPFSVVQYCPNFFFGALLLWFGVEISRDWLVGGREGVCVDVPLKRSVGLHLGFLTPLPRRFVFSFWYLTWPFPQPSTPGRCCPSTSCPCASTCCCGE